MTHFFDEHAKNNAQDRDEPTLTSDDADSIDQEEDGDLFPEELKAALVLLLKRGTVLAKSKPALYQLFLRHQNVARSYLAKLYLSLVIDQQAGIVFIASEETDDEQAQPSLISKRTLSLYDTLVILILRKHYQDREATGEQTITIDSDTLLSRLVPFIALTQNSADDRKKLLTSLNKMSERQVLRVISGSEDRYEITPLIRYVVSADVLERLLADYVELAGGNKDGVLFEDHEQATPSASLAEQPVSNDDLFSDKEGVQP